MRHHNTDTADETTHTLSFQSVCVHTTIQMPKRSILTNICLTNTVTKRPHSLTCLALHHPYSKGITTTRQQLQLQLQKTTTQRESRTTRKRARHNRRVPIRRRLTNTQCRRRKVRTISKTFTRELRSRRRKLSPNTGSTAKTSSISSLNRRRRVRTRIKRSNRSSNSALTTRNRNRVTTRFDRMRTRNKTFKLSRRDWCSRTNGT